MVNVKLRPWQREALSKALKWLTEDRRDRHFLINAAPGAGKTIAACVIAQALMEKKEIDRVIIIAPLAEVVSQWAKEFEYVTGNFMAKITPRDRNDQLDVDFCVTWAAVKSLENYFKKICQSKRVLVICDEHHHAAVEAAWGTGADGAFADAKFALILTGTPIRSDRNPSIWLAYDDRGKIDHPDEGTYTLTYGNAVDMGYCRPATFHRHEGKFTVHLDDDTGIKVSGHEAAKLPSDLSRIPGLQRVLDFYHLACTPQYEKDKTTPLLTGYQATMIKAAREKLIQIRYRMPNAGGLIITPSIHMAEYVAELINLIEGEKPFIVHSAIPNYDEKIKAFRRMDARWIVSVAMISEGVDIQRLRVLVYLPKPLTELAFRQAVGRVVRSSDIDDDTRAYVVIPSFEVFDRYARRVEEELSSGSKKPDKKPRKKRCPICYSECDLTARICKECGNEFPSSDESHEEPLSDEFIVTLDDALRDGVIARGMDIDEEETLEAEEIAPNIREKILLSGDAKLVKLLQTFPDETFARLKKILDDPK